MTSDPFDVLGVDRQSDDAAIRRRYLELVRQYPPDREPERFAAIRQAYEQLRDPVVRLESMLFSMATDDSLDAIVAEVTGRLRTARIPTETLLSLAEQR